MGHAVVGILDLRMAAHWIVERTQSTRFPFRIRVEQDGRTLFAVRAQSKWPGAGKQIFCLREAELDPAEALEPEERVPVLHLRRLGRKLSVTLDRPQRKRCEFLKLEKQRRDGSGTYEQIFLRTELAARAHRTSGRAELSTRLALEVVVDTAERYPWRFPGASVTRRSLPVGDYALTHKERLLAVVERKSFPNFLRDMCELRGLHQQIAELGSYAHAALVVEAQYADLGKPDRIGRWPAAHLLRVVGELAALHPSVPVVFAGNRKLANVWTQRFFAAVDAARRQPEADLVRDAVSEFEPAPVEGGLDARIRAAALEELSAPFAIADLRDACPGVGDARLRRVLHQLRREGRLRCEGRGRAARWVRA